VRSDSRLFGERTTIVIAIYLRVSTDKQETAAQRHEIDKWCQQQGYEACYLMSYIDHGISGKRSDNRPELQRLLSDVRGGQIRRVITFEPSRLSRDYVEFLRIMQLLSEHQVELEIPAKGIQAFSSSTDKLIMSVQAYVASQFLEDHSKRVKAGMAAARARDPDIEFGAPVGNQFRKGKKKDYPQELLARIQRLRSKGFSTREIADEVGLSQSTISRIISTRLAT
jgi:DNA invertase Pin-like site-specific DNA recombinase